MCLTKLDVVQFNINLRSTQLDKHNNYVHISTNISHSTFIFTCNTMCTNAIQDEQNINIYMSYWSYGDMNECKKWSNRD